MVYNEVRWSSPGIYSFFLSKAYKIIKTLPIPVQHNKPIVQVFKCIQVFYEQFRHVTLSNSSRKIAHETVVNIKCENGSFWKKGCCFVIITIFVMERRFLLKT